MSALPGAELLTRLTRETARLLEQIANDRQLQRVNERDHLSKCFRQALIEELPGTSYRTACPGERQCNFPEHFPRVGDVDELIVPEDGAPIWVELKCNSNPKWALAACGWDAIKSTVGLARGAASDAYLLAGAPTTIWQAGVLGAHLFDGGRWLAADVRDLFAEPFRSYEELADPRPVLVPEAFSTEQTGDPAEFTVDATPWQLRLARVTLNGHAEGWYSWPAFLTAEEQAAALVRRTRR